MSRGRLAAKRTAGVAAAPPAAQPARAPGGEPPGEPGGVVIPPAAVITAMAFGALAAALMLADGVRSTSTASEITWLVAILLCLVLAGLGAVGGYRRRAVRIRWMYVGPWYLIWFGVTFVLGALAWRTQPTSTNPIMQTSVVGALMVLGVGLVAWAAGYLLGPGRLAVAAGRRLAAVVAPEGSWQLRSPAVIWCLFWISVAARAVQILTDQFGYTGNAERLVSTPAATGQMLGLAGQCGQFAVLVAAIDFVRNRDSRRRWRLLVLLAFEVLVGALDGMRQDFILTVLGLIVVFAVAGAFPWRSLLAAVLLFVVVYTPYNSAYRTMVRGDERLTSLQAVSVAPSVLRRTLLEGSSRETVDGSVEVILQRLRLVNSVAIVVQRTPEQVPYKPVTELLAAPVVGIVPRFVWPDKPVFDGGYRFAQEYYGASSTTYSSAAVTPQGDLYRRGGLLVVVCGMVVLGMAARLVDRTLHPSRDLRLAVLFVPIFVLLIKSEADVGALAASVPTHLAFAVLIARVSFARRRDEPGTPPAGPEQASARPAPAPAPRHAAMRGSGAGAGRRRADCR